MRTYYSVLEIPEQATPTAIKSAFKRLAVKYHPDKNPNDPRAEECFKEVNEAYQVLSDPTRKFMYDQRIQSVRQMGSQAHSSTGHGSSPRSRGSYMSQSRDRRTRWREARDHYRPHGFTGKATGSGPSVRAAFNRKKDQRQGFLSAISFVGTIALIVSLGISVYTMAKRMEESAKRNERMAFISKLKNSHDADSIRSTLAIIDRRIEEQDEFDPFLYDFRNDVIKIMKEDAQRLYNREEYKEALRYLQVWKEEFPQDREWLDPQIVSCQIALDKIGRAEKMLKDIQRSNRNHLFVYMTLGKIYRDYQNKPEDALFYYSKASQQIIKSYKEEYGEAYAIMMNPRATPPSQYEVFMAKADLGLQLGKYRVAKNAAAWASMLRPNKTEGWLRQATAYQKLNRQDKACESWRKAMEFGHVTLLDSLIKYCKKP